MTQRFELTQAQSATNRTPRQINRNLIFNLIRKQQPISRAELARVSGLQRSTVSLIVEGLISEKWVIEGQIGKLPRGRRPTMLHLNDKRAVVALDIHPSQTTVAIADLGGHVIARNLITLSAEPQRAVRTIVQAVQKIIAANKDKSIDGIGISLPGRADIQLQKLIFAPNLKWPVVAIKSRIERATGLRVEIDNVANACALSEVWFGDSDGMRDLVVVNVSEGIGTGIFANGQLVRGESGMAGEFGHIEIEPNGTLCACGNRGCWETAASNRAAMRYYQAASPDTSVRSFEDILKRSHSGDKAAILALEKMAHYLGRGMRMIVSALAPGEIVIVGDLTTAWHICGPIVQAELQQNSYFKVPAVRPAYEGSTARLRSAVALVMNEGMT